MRRVYRANSQRTGVPWRGRSYVAGRPMAAGDDVNRLLSAAHACLYGLVHAAVVSLGCSPGLGFIHTGNALAFVHDIADLYKAEITIPCAFDVAAAGRTSEAAVRYVVRDRIKETRLLERAVRDVYLLLDEELGHEAHPADDQRDDRPLLWGDEGVAGKVDTLAGGTAWDLLDPSLS